MPTATPFTALGRGNGFPFCLSKVNVLDNGDEDEYDYWTTLGGTNKTNHASLTAEQIQTNVANSLVNAMKLFWNLYAINATCSISGTNGIQTAEASRSELTVAYGSSAQPLERVCELLAESSTTDTESIVNSGFTWIATASMFAGIDWESAVRFYYGSTSDESNFIGYGLSSFYGDPSTISYSSIQSNLNFTAAAIFYDQDDVIGNSAGAYECLGGLVNEENADWTYSYEVVSGISFIKAVGDYYEGSGTEPVRSVTIDSIDFYTYS
jgi:hypothetical protein